MTLPGGSFHAKQAAIEDDGRPLAGRRQSRPLLDQTNYRKSVDQLLALLQVLNCDVDLVVRTKTA